MKRILWLLTALLVCCSAGAPVWASQEELSAIIKRIEAANGLPNTMVKTNNLETSDTLNAYTDGQKVVVTTGLWNKLQTDDERAFVVGHEMAHIAQGHIAKSSVRRVGLQLASRLLQAKLGAGLASTASNVGLQLVDKKFSRSQEFEADDVGLQLMRKAGYQPKAALKVFAVLKAASPGGTPEFLLTHPISDARIQALVKKYSL